MACDMKTVDLHSISHSPAIYLLLYTQLIDKANQMYWKWASVNSQPKKNNKYICIRKTFKY